MYNTVINLLDKKIICDDTVLFEFIVPLNNYGFNAGQYAHFKITDENYKDEKGNSRIFSFANSPLNKGKIEISARMKNSKFTQFLFSLEPGSALLLSEAKGKLKNFFSENNKIAVLAGGMGITPIRSIVNDMFLKSENKNITLFYVNKTPSKSAFLNEFMLYENAIPDLKFIPVFENGIFHSANSETGVISFDLIKKHVNSPESSVYLLLGSPKSVASYQSLLLRNGIRPDNIFQDK